MNFLVKIYHVLDNYLQIVKATPATAEKYNLPENEPVMLYGRKNLIRLVQVQICLLEKYVICSLESCAFYFYLFFISERLLRLLRKAIMLWENKLRYQMNFQDISESAMILKEMKYP